VLLIEPNNVTARLGLAQLAEGLGEFPEAERLYEQALAAARSPEDRARVQDSTLHYHESRGRIDLAIDRLELFLAEMERSASPMNSARPGRRRSTSGQSCASRLPTRAPITN
jgi:tetratricopeptide (TPR) repeat protein